MLIFYGQTVALVLVRLILEEMELMAEQTLLCIHLQLFGGLGKSLGMKPENCDQVIN